MNKYGLLGLGLLAVVLLSLGTASAAYRTDLGQEKQSPPALPKQVTLVVQGERIVLKPADLGWQLDTRRINREKEQRGPFDSREVPAYTKVDRTVLARKLRAIAEARHHSAVDAKIIDQNGDYAISPSVVGQRIDADKAVKMVKSGLSIRKTTMTLPVAQIPPAVSEVSLQPQLQQLKAQRAATNAARAAQLRAAQAARAKPAAAGACAGNRAGRQLVLVNLSQQHLWACKGTAQAYETAITSGAYLAGTATPTGTWHIYSKSRNIHLIGPGYNYPVNYWMPFYADYGFHDSYWQTFPYGSPQYASGGSHGCIHVPLGAMGWLYSWAPVGTTVTITR